MCGVTKKDKIRYEHERISKSRTSDTEDHRGKAKVGRERKKGTCSEEW